MKVVGVKHLKNQLSAYLREVAGGEVVLVTDRGKVIAELRRPSVGAAVDPLERELERLVATGRLTRGLPHDPSLYKLPEVCLRGTTSDQLLEEDRRERDLVR